MALQLVLLQMLLQAGPQPLPLPDLQPNVNLWGVLGWAALNPAMIAVAWAMGRRADQPAKYGLAAFVASLAGIALMWLVARLHAGIAVDTARAAAGVFMAALPFGVCWAWAGRTFGGARRS